MSLEWLRSRLERRQTADFSAESVAAARAMAARDRDILVRNPDYLAAEFLGKTYRLIGKLPGVSRLATAGWERRIPGIYNYLNARTHHIDRVMADEMKAGIQQVVVLGAGYDSRAFRLRAILGDARMFEVDQPGTRSRKLAILHDRFGAVPSQVTYVAHDFTEGSFFPSLERAGYATGEPCFFIWEGVSYYLVDADVDRLLLDLSRRAAPGSSIIFDYLYRCVLRGEGDLYGAAGAMAFLQSKRRPYLSGIERGASASFMRERGFDVASDLEPSAMERRYLVRADGRVQGRIFGGYGMMHAHVSGRPASGE